MASLKNNIKRLVRCLRNFKEFWKRGGVTVASIKSIEYGDCLKGLRALVTGGSSGIGFAIAKKLADSGAIVVATGRNMEKLNAAKANAASDRFHTYQWDITDISAIDEHLKKVRSLVGGDIDVLVNNAGVLLSGQTFFNVDEDIWDKTYSTNLKGAYFLSQKVAKHWIDHKRGGKILNISSQGGFCAASYPYRMTKWDMVGMTKGLGKLLAPHGIIVNGIAPGMIATDMIGRSSDNIFSELQANRRLGLSEEIAELAHFMLSPACMNIIGQTIICDGGYTLVS